MRRRAFVFASGVWIAAAPASAFAQAREARRIAFVHPGSESGWRTRLEAFRSGLKELGYTEGRDVLIDVRWGNDKSERFQELAYAVVASKPELIVTATSVGTAAFRNATKSVPIIFATAFNPVEQGFVASLSRPGGNITGVLVQSGLTPKNIEIAREALPKARRLAMFVHEPDPAHRFALTDFDATARRFDFEPILVRIAGTADFDRAFAELAQRKADVLFLPQLAFFTSERRQLAQRALKARLPLLTTLRENTESGAFLSYGSPLEENFRRAAVLVDKVLRGARPGELAVEQPERYELVVNRKTAAAIGVELAPVTLLRAQKIID